MNLGKIGGYSPNVPANRRENWDSPGYFFTFLSYNLFL
jgi:hypothetical protein